MKKITLALIAIFALQASVSAFAMDKLIQYNELPAVAKSFVKKHFAAVKVASTWIDDDLMDKDYTVQFENGSTIDFTPKGEWKEVKCPTTAVPAAIIPTKITSYLSANYADAKCIKIEKEGRGGYEVKLSSGVSLKFDAAQKFLGIDD